LDQIQAKALVPLLKGNASKKDVFNIWKEVLTTGEADTWEKKSLLMELERVRGNLPKGDNIFAQDVLSLIERLEVMGLFLEAKRCLGQDFLLLVAAHWQRRVREIVDFKKKSHNIKKIAKELVWHLFAKYETPHCLFYPWQTWNRQEYAARKDHLGWFFHVAQGGNIRTAPQVPNISKKEAHLFLTAPKEYAPDLALRWARVKALGGSSQFVDSIKYTRIGLIFADEQTEAFCVSVIRFFLANPWLDTAQYIVILDWLWNQKFEPRLVGGFRQPPPQPGLSMKGRTAQTVLREAERWHRELLRGYRETGRENTCVVWPKSSLSDYESADKGDRIGIFELTSSLDLQDEGKRLHHCVYSFAHSCSKGRSAIFSMREVRADNSVGKSLATIEVHLEYRIVVQARGFANEPLSVQQIQHLNRWARGNQLSVGKYL